MDSGNRHAQAAQMTLAPGATEGGPDNRHRGSDQWLFVVAGTGLAVVNKNSHPLRAGTLLLVEHGDTHTIRNTGREPRLPPITPVGSPKDRHHHRRRHPGAEASKKHHRSREGVLLSLDAESLMRVRRGRQISS